MITIRTATPDDWDTLIDIWEASVRATHHFLPEAHILYLRQQIRDVYLPQLYVYVAITETDNIAGFICSVEGNIEMLFVSPTLHRQGIGKQLIRYAIDTLGANSVDVNEQNPQGVAFYAHMGFKTVSRSEVDGEGYPYPLLHLKLISTLC